MRRWLRLLRALRFYSATRPLVVDSGVEVDYNETHLWTVAKELVGRSDISEFSRYEDRFQQGDCFACLTNSDGVVVTYGWYTSRDSMPISEVGLFFRTKGDVVLFDFYTPRQFQRRGYYGHLLRMIVTQNAGKTAWIYVLRDNTTSWKAIERAGFCKMSVLRLILTGRFSKLTKRHTLG